MALHNSIDIPSHKTHLTEPFLTNNLTSGGINNRYSYKNLNNVEQKRDIRDAVEKKSFIATPSINKNRMHAHTVDPSNISKHRKEKQYKMAIQASHAYQYEMAYGDTTRLYTQERLNFSNLDTQQTNYEWYNNPQTGRGLYKWLICLLIGTLTGLTMYMATIVIQVLLDAVLKIVRDRVDRSWAEALLLFLGFNLTMASISGFIVAYFQPVAGGSGIPEVKAWLNGSAVPRLLNLKTLLIKIIGVILAVGSSFCIGKEGPMVHSGAVIANGMSNIYLNIQ